MRRDERPTVLKSARLRQRLNKLDSFDRNPEHSGQNLLRLPVDLFFAAHTEVRSSQVRCLYQIINALLTSNSKLLSLYETYIRNLRFCRIKPYIKRCERVLEIPKKIISDSQVFDDEDIEFHSFVSLVDEKKVDLLFFFEENDPVHRSIKNFAVFDQPNIYQFKANIFAKIASHSNLMSLMRKIKHVLKEEKSVQVISEKTQPSENKQTLRNTLPSLQKIKSPPLFIKQRFKVLKSERNQIINSDESSIRAKFVVLLKDIETQQKKFQNQFSIHSRLSEISISNDCDADLDENLSPSPSPALSLAFDNELIAFRTFKWNICMYLVLQITNKNMMCAALKNIASAYNSKVSDLIRIDDLV